MLAGGAKINWKNAELPLGRTVGTCKWKYDSLMAKASGITMSSGDAITPSTPAKKRGKSAKKAAAGADEDDIGAQTTTPTKRNKRKSPIDDDDVEATSPKKNAKKAKVEQAEEDSLGEEVADDAF